MVQLASFFPPWPVCKARLARHLSRLLMPFHYRGAKIRNFSQKSKSEFQKKRNRRIIRSLTLITAICVYLSHLCALTPDPQILFLKDFLYDFLRSNKYMEISTLKLFDIPKYWSYLCRAKRKKYPYAPHHPPHEAVIPPLQPAILPRLPPDTGIQDLKVVQTLWILQ